MVIRPEIPGRNREVTGSGSTMRTIQYGPEPDQEADLVLPQTPHPPVVCLLHGGFWRMPHGRDQMGAIAEDLAARGFAVWNLEYRRLGNPEAGWPATMEDAAAGIDFLGQLGQDGAPLDLARVAVAGHSAGGHLALWAAGKGPDGTPHLKRIRLRAVIGLAPITDLAEACHRGLGGNAVAELIGGVPGQVPERFASASPIEMVPLGVRQIILHGTEDAVVPVDWSRRYAAAAAKAGDTVELIELPGAGHMEVLDPGSGTHTALCRCLADCMSGP